MKTPMAKENVFTVALSVAVVLVLGILFLEWQHGLQLQMELTKMRSLPVTPAPTQKILEEFNLPNVEAGFPEFLSRSLFAVSRRSSASASAGKGVSVMKKGQFVLVGVLITPQHRSALLRDVQTNKTETVALVGVVRGITLGEVEPNRVVLRQGAESEELALIVQAGPKQPALPQSRPLGGPASSPLAVPSPVPGTRSNAPSAAPPGPPEIPATVAPGGSPMVGSPMVGPTLGAQAQPTSVMGLRVPGPPSVSQ